MTRPKKDVISCYATENDIQFIISGIREINKIEEEPFESVAVLSKKIIRAIKKKEIILLIKKQPIGFIWGAVAKKAPYGLNYRDEKQRFCWISWVFIVKSQRNKGFGSLLYKLVEKDCKKKSVKKIMLDVFEINPGSEKFHSKLGFKPKLTIYEKNV